MNVLLIHVGADTTNLGVVGPIFSNGTFEFIPINNFCGLETRTYANLLARNKQFGDTLADFLPSNVGNLNPHPDPDFDAYTFGEPNNPEPIPRALRKLKPEDMLFFVSSLAPYDQAAYQAKDSMLQVYQRGKKNKYVIGFFRVKGIVLVHVVRSAPRLTLALLHLLSLLEEGEGFPELGDLTSELRTLQEIGYTAKKQDTYELTDDGRELALWFSDLLYEKKSDEEKKSFLEEGIFDVEPLAGSIPKDILKTNHHIRRLKPVDRDYCIVLAGEQEGSALLTRAVQLTQGFERVSFKLNQLGRTILGRDTDTLRGVRWIDENAGKLLAEAIAKTNSDLEFNLQSYFE